MRNTILFVILLMINQGFADSKEISPASNTVETLKRPQEPKAPYPYDEEEVTFENKTAGVKLAGTLTLPRCQGPFPVVVLLHGSAPLDRDSALFGHKPFLVWSDHLTRQGIAVLRFDKRNAGKSTGNYATSTVEDFAKDALAAVEYLKTRKEIHPKKIGLVGHSEGGWTATLAASQSSDVAFTVLMASPCVKWEDLMHMQGISLLRAEGASEELVAQSRKFYKQIFTILQEEKNIEIADKKLQDACTMYLRRLTPTQQILVQTCFGPIKEQVKVFNSAWFRYACTHDSADILKKVKVPVLALNGDREFVVSSEQNLKQIGKVLQEAKHPDFTLIELPGLNHAFQACQTGSLREIASIEETVSP
ncbi:MAG TPA: alpha/beta fold hydrolase, partial [Candidatus Babeliaceae bacterium]|nr:alpha/beta fold hydrolase [Candidatus Babeliaceae bacterium]